MKRTLSLIMSVILLITAIPFLSFSINARREISPIMKYSDVTIGTWYYAAVKQAFTDGYMTGIDEKHFAPNNKITRAAYATVLSNISGAISDRYFSESDLDDVESGKWYTKSINWAIENNVMSGIGNNRFGTDSYLTREMLILSLYSLAEKGGYDTVNIKDNALDAYSDVSELHNWGEMRKAMKWAVSLGIITGKGGKSLAPGDTATRAETAQIIMKFLKTAVEKPNLQITINGTDISEYKIVCSANATITEKYAVSELKKYIYRTNAVILQSVTDENTPGEHEIIIGKTNREGATVSVDRALFKTEEATLIKTEAGSLVIAGGGDRGTIYAVYEFLEKYLDWRFYTEDYELCRSDTSVIDVSDVNDIQHPSFEYRDVHMMTYTMQDIAVKRRVNGPYHRLINENKGGQISVCGNDSYFVHTLNKLYGIDDEYRNACTAVTESNIDIYMNAIEKVIASDPSSKIISVSACDSQGAWCRCADCKKMEAEYPDRYDRWIVFINAIADRLKSSHPDMKLLTLAYLDSYNSTGKISPRENVLLMACPIDGSMTLDISDTENEKTKRCFENYSKLCKNGNLYVWEYPVTLSDSMVGVPNVYNIVNHLKFYHSVGVNGVFMEGRSLMEMSSSSGRIVGWENDGEFGNLKAYLASKLLWNADLTSEETEALIVEYMQDYYGSEWETVYNCFKMLAYYSDKMDFSLSIFDPNTERLICGLYTTKEIRKMSEAIETALENVYDKKSYDNLSILSVMFDAMIINRLWDIYYRSSNSEDRNYIISVNERMYKKMVKYYVYPRYLSYTNAYKNETVFSNKIAKYLIKEGK